MSPMKPSEIENAFNDDLVDVDKDCTDRASTDADKTVNVDDMREFNG